MSPDGLTAEGRNFIPGQIYILDTKTAVEITGARVEHCQHKLEANVLALRWRSDGGLHALVAPNSWGAANCGGFQASAEA